MITIFLVEEYLTRTFFCSHFEVAVIPTAYSAPENALAQAAARIYMVLALFQITYFLFQAWNY